MPTYFSAKRLMRLLKHLNSVFTIVFAFILLDRSGDDMKEDVLGKLFRTTHQMGRSVGRFVSLKTVKLSEKTLDI